MSVLCVNLILGGVSEMCEEEPFQVGRWGGGAAENMRVCACVNVMCLTLFRILGQGSH